MKLLLTLLFLIGLMMSVSDSIANDGLEEIGPSRILKFKKIMNFDAILSLENKREYIDMDWEHLHVPPHLTEWRVHLRELREPLNVGEKRFTLQLRRNDEVITIESTVFTSTEEAGAQFLEVADASTMSKIPYVQGPATLGTLSAVDRNRIFIVFWFYKNVFSKVIRSGTEVSHLAIAAWVQEQLERHKKVRTR